MSFSSELKSEICKIKPSGCCAFSELYGILLFSKTFKNDTSFFSTDRQDIAKRISDITKSVYNFMPKIDMSLGRYSLSADIINVATLYTDIVSVEYITDVFNCDNCFTAFVRGAFLVSGTVTDPEKDFHIEIKTLREEVAISLQSVLLSKGLNARISKRKQQHLVYFKGSENVSDFITFLGGYKKSLDVIDVAVVKELRNKINRAKNCETANIGKTVNAAIKQREAIDILKKAGRLSGLSDELKIAADIRYNNPDMSLTEMSAKCGISRSGLNHRLNRLISLANEIKDVK